MSPSSDAPGDHLVGTRAVRILSTKYDGSHHNDFVGRLFEEERGPGDPLRLLVEAGTMMRSYRGEYAIGFDFTALFWPDLDRWWNVEHNHWTVLRPTGRQSPESYANISLPASFDGETLRWVDMDLDVVIREGQVALVDEDEFAEHLERMRYPEDVIARCRAAAEDLLALAEPRLPPWDRERHIWRRHPGT